MRMWGFVAILVISVLVPVLSRAGISIDQRIISVLANEEGGYSYVKGCGVVDTSSGDIIAAWVKDPSLRNRRTEMAYTIRDIILAVNKNIKKFGYEPAMVGIRFKEGMILIAPIDYESFVACFYGPEVNEAEQRLLIRRKLVPNLKSILH